MQHAVETQPQCLETWAWDPTNWALSRAQKEAGSSVFAPPKGELTNHKYTILSATVTFGNTLFDAGKRSKHAANDSQASQT